MHKSIVGLLSAAAVALFFTGCASTSPSISATTTRATDEAAIRHLVARLGQSFRTKNVDGVMSAFAPDVISFDLGAPLRHGGGEAFRKRWQGLFASYQGPIDFEVRDLKITTGADVAFSYSLNRVGGIMKDGRHTGSWRRWTACYRKTNGQWQIVHEQVSFPTDLKTGQALRNLQP